MILFCVGVVNRIALKSASGILFVCAKPLKFANKKNRVIFYMIVNFFSDSEQYFKQSALDFVNHSQKGLLYENLVIMNLLFRFFFHLPLCTELVVPDVDFLFFHTLLFPKGLSFLRNSNRKNVFYSRFDFYSTRIFHFEYLLPTVPNLLLNNYTDLK